MWYPLGHHKSQTVQQHVQSHHVKIPSIFHFSAAFDQASTSVYRSSRVAVVSFFWPTTATRLVETCHNSAATGNSTTVELQLQSHNGRRTGLD
jgi:hypothetical protein